MEQLPDNDCYIVRLTTKQVLDGWDWIYSSIAKSLPPGIKEDETVKASLIQSVQSNDLTVWAAYQVKDGKGDVIGIMSTRVVYDTIAKQKTLLIYSLTAIKSLLPIVWNKGLKALKQLCKQDDIKSIIAYTRLEKLAQFSKNYGGIIHYVVELEV